MVVMRQPTSRAGTLRSVATVGLISEAVRERFAAGEIDKDDFGLAGSEDQLPGDGRSPPAVLAARGARSVRGRQAATTTTARLHLRRRRAPFEPRPSA